MMYNHKRFNLKKKKARKQENSPLASNLTQNENQTSLTQCGLISYTICLAPCSSHGSPCSSLNMLNTLSTQGFCTCFLSQNALLMDIHMSSLSSPLSLCSNVIASVAILTKLFKLTVSLCFVPWLPSCFIFLCSTSTNEVIIYFTYFSCLFSVFT